MDCGQELWVCSELLQDLKGVKQGAGRVLLERNDDRQILEVGLAPKGTTPINVEGRITVGIGGFSSKYLLGCRS